ncbi:hypothetical protein HWV23_15775 [Natronomonas halophila]|uniref:ArnT family glycosyltransferase n=1 Tax=Natronomonas halophila TaxID=2747817 RepID=UPI0015B39D68|nr:hypothetical protein [Natronomonas halophila]QLD87120.1 hypothetical protein HWV23_15775 [Natronomonas halophila]
MSHQNRLQQLLVGDRLDVTLAKVGVIASVLLLGLRLLTQEVLFVVIPTAAGVACVVYLAAQNRQSTAFEFAVLPRAVIGYLPSFVFAGLAGLVLLTYSMGGRTTPVYLLTGAIGATILAQILVVDDEALVPGLVLVQILVAAVVIRMTALFLTPGFIGVDIWTHVPVYITGIVEAESLSAISDSKYIMAPLYHTLGAIGALTFGSVRTGMYLSAGLLLPLSALFVYTTGKLFVPVRWALLATALFAFADQFIRWGIHIIPTSLGLVFFLGALYCVTKLYYTDDLWLVGLLFVFSLATVFTHQVSTAILLVFLGAAAVTVAVTQLLGTRHGRATTWSTVGIVGVFVVTLAVTILSWLNTPWFGDQPFLLQMLDTLQRVFTTDAGFLNLAGDGGSGGGAESADLFAQSIPFIEWFGFALLLLMAVVGGLAMLRMEMPPELTLTYLLSAAAMFVIVFGFSLFGIRAIMPGRWLAFMYAVFALIGAAGLYHLSQNASRRVLLVILVVVAVGYPMTMVVTEKATLDSPAFDEEYPRYSYTESEIAAAETISTIHSTESDLIIDSDHPYQTLYKALGGYTARVVELEETGSVSPRPVIYRDYQTYGPAVFHEATATEAERPVESSTVDPDRVCPPTRNHVYANDAVKMCTTPGVDTGVSL